MTNTLHAGVYPPVLRHGAEGEGSSASPLMGLDVSKHASHVALTMPSFGNETFSTGNMVNAESAHKKLSESSTRRSPGSPARSNASWTADDEAAVRSMWLAGGADEDIARFLGRSRTSIATRRSLLGIGKRQRF